MKALKDSIIKIDLVWEFIVPYLACVYLVYNNAAYTKQIILYGWVACMVHFIITIMLFLKPDKENAFLLSFINILVFIILLFMGYLSLRGYLIVSLIAEIVATILAFMFSLLFSKNKKGVSASESIGGLFVFLNLFLFAGSIYPFLKEWEIFLIETEASTIYWIQGIFLLFFATWKKHKSIHALNSEKSVPQKSNKKSASDTPLILGALFLWFGGLGILAMMN